MASGTSLLDRMILVAGGIEMSVGGLMAAVPTLFPQWVAWACVGVGLATIIFGLYRVRVELWDWLLQKAVERSGDTKGSASEAGRDPYWKRHTSIRTQRKARFMSESHYGKGTVQRFLRNTKSIQKRNTSGPSGTEFCCSKKTHSTQVRFHRFKDRYFPKTMLVGTGILRTPMATGSSFFQSNDTEGGSHLSALRACGNTAGFAICILEPHHQTKVVFRNS
ncbi:MAG: hypothetical protein QOD89_1935 [Bradyrhizobium sp.]|nr:hypothetical protein [Bradyrhizobium sp.]